MLYKTGNNEPLGRGVTPKKSDNTSETISNFDNVIERGPELPCSWICILYWLGLLLQP